MPVSGSVKNPHESDMMELADAPFGPPTYLLKNLDFRPRLEGKGGGSGSPE